MRFRPTFVIFLCLFICVCIGAPPKQAGETSKRSMTRYTDEEDQFIVDEFSRIIKDYRYIPLTGEHVWKEIEDNHRVKWINKTPHFPQERTYVSLCRRFIKVLMHNHAATKVKVPDTLLQKLRNSKRKTTAVHRHAYNMEEDNFIIEELLKPSNKSPLNKKVFKGIEAEHNKRRKGTAHGFENERSYLSIRTRIATMRDAGLLPNEVMDKFLMRGTGAGSSGSAHSSAQTDTLGLDEEDEDSEIELGDDAGHRSKYTEEEETFLVKQLLSFSDETLTRKAVWENIAERHRKKLEKLTKGFRKERSAESLERHFRYFMVCHPKCSKVEVPESLVRKFTNLTPGKTKGGKVLYSKEEDNLIIEELLKPSYTNMFGSSTVEKLLAEHNKRREANIPGFENERTLRGLGGHLAYMRKTGQLPEEVLKKIWIAPAGGSSSGSAQPSQQTNQQDPNTDVQDTSKWIEELENADCYVDFNQLRFIDDA